MRIQLWLIWNFERRMWWKPNSHGYTKKREEAGTYTLGEAVTILRDADTLKKDVPPDAMVPE